MIETPPLSREIGLPAQELATLLICAVRYSLGRRTYMPGLVADSVRRYGKRLGPGQLRILARDIEEQAKLGYGDPCDETTWRELLAWLQAAIAESEPAAEPA